MIIIFNAVLMKTTRTDGVFPLEFVMQSNLNKEV